MDSSHSEERRQTRGSLIHEFEFYFQFIRSLVLDLPEEDDKSIAAAWVHKLRPETFDSEETENIRLRLDYLKLLLFVLQRRHLVGIFRRTPPDGPLEPFPHNFNITDMGSLLLEEDERQALGGGDAWGTPYAIEISNDLKEFVAAQEIPNFGVQVYYAMSTDDPIHKWSMFDERRLPKFIREKIEQLKIMKSAGNMDLLKSKQSLLTEQSQSLKDLEEITNLNKCTSKVKSPLEIETSQERVYQAYMNYGESRQSGFNDKCGGNDNSWRKSRTSKKVCPDGSKVEMTKIEQGGPCTESDMASRAPVRIARSSTIHQVEVQGDDEKAVEAAAQKELNNLMKEHPPSSSVKDSSPCDCPGHPQANQRPPSRRCGSERTSRQRTDNNFSPPVPERKSCPSEYPMDSSHPPSSMQVKSRSPCRSPCNQGMTFNEEIYIPSPGPQRQRTPCGHMKKHGCGGPRSCCPCPKKCMPQESPSPHCNCKNRDRNAPRPEPEKYSQRSPCRPRTCGSGNMRYEQSDLNSRHRDYNAQGQHYERSDCNQIGRIPDERDREQDRKARLRRIAELDSNQRNQRCPSAERDPRCSPEPIRESRCPPEPRDQRCAPEIRDQRCPPDSRDQRFTPEPRDQRCPPESREQRFTPEPRDQRCPPESREQRFTPEPRDQRCPPESREQRFTPEPRDQRCPPESREQRCPPEPRDQRSPPDFRGGANFSNRMRLSDPCPCPCPREGESGTGSRYQGREPIEDASSPCIGASIGRTPRRSNMMSKDPCYDEGSRGTRNVSPSARQIERPPERQGESRCPPKSTGFKEMEVKSICNKTTRYNCPDKNQKTPVVNKTCIVEKSEKIIKPCSSGDAVRNGSSAASPAGRNYSQEECDDDNILDHCQDDIELPSLTFEKSIPCPPDDRRRYFDDPYSRRMSSPTRYTSTPKPCYGGGRTPDFPGDISRIRRPDDFRELTMKSPKDPDIGDATCVSSNDSDSDTPEFCDELSGLSPDTPSPGRRIENMGIKDYLCEGLTEDISGITEDEFVDAPQMSPDDTFSSPDFPDRAQTPRKNCPPCPPCPPCPGSRQERTRGGYQPPPPSPQSRPPSRTCYETPARKLRHRVDSNAPLPIPRRPDYSPVSRQMLDDSQTSDSDGYEYNNAQRNLLSALEKADRTDRNRPMPSRTESESVWERGRDEMRSCGCDEDTSDADAHYNRRSRYD